MHSEADSETRPEAGGERDGHEPEHEPELDVPEPEPEPERERERDEEPDLPRFSRAMAALTAAATIAVAPFADVALAPAGSGRGAHSIPVYLMARVSHDIGHNDWAFQGATAGRVEWVAVYVAIGLFWAGVAGWMWTRARVGRRERRGGRLWLRALLTAWGTQFVMGVATLGAGVLAAWNSSGLDPVLLRAADLCSPWWSFAAVTAVVARAERNRPILYAAAGYGLLLAIVSAVPVPLPDVVKALLLAAAAAAPCLTAPRRRPTGTGAARVRPDAAAAG